MNEYKHNIYILLMLHSRLLCPCQKIFCIVAIVPAMKFKMKSWR